MKNIFGAILLLFSIISCTKQEFTQTTDTFKRADSLFTKANDGLKTLDSISKRVNDSNGIAKKVIIPQIEKQTKRIDSTLKSGSWQIDSINKEIAKITKHVKTGTDVAKTLDSASQLLKNGENAIAVLSQTANRILKQTQQTDDKSAKPKNDIPAAPSAQREENTVTENPRPKDPLIKTSFLEIEVEDLSDAKALLRQQLRDSNGSVISENYTTSEGIRKEEIMTKIPMRDFDYFVQSISAQLGDIKTKNTTARGTDLMSGSNGSVEIILVQKHQNIVTAMPAEVSKESTANTDGETFGTKSSSAFKSGFDILGKVFLALLPFWPVFLIVAIILFFISRNRKKKQIINLERTNHVEDSEEISQNPQIKPDKPVEDNEPDYSRYLPKE
ncbi:DUF4349 domain-containing protein [Kaistella polysaccharea]|uniref:DUF4349 domain-containing protein n=1 Tax=Kaistella polysaccharea TaxID=2878534 RepID=UPI001CF3E95A|nr:DUF4349 domain-containing protein [Kaistella polysaccharea]